MTDPIPILLVDMIDYSKRSEAWRRTLTSELQDALTEAARIFLPHDDPWKIWTRHGTGDGYYVFLHGDLGCQIALRFALKLDSVLIERNRKNPELNLRLRMVLVDGTVANVGDQYAGDALIEAARLVDCEEIRRAAEDLEKTTVLALSVHFHYEVRRSLEESPSAQLEDLLWMQINPKDKHGTIYPAKLLKAARLGSDGARRAGAAPETERVSESLPKVELSEIEPEPQATDPKTARLADDLDDAHERLAECSSETEANNIREEILRLKRLLREGARLKPGDVLDGRFKLLEEIGHGGFAQVWRAFDRRIHEIVAVKVLHIQHTRDLTKRERFFRGARQMAKLRCPGVVQVIEPEIQDGFLYFFVMEYLPGGDLRQAILTGDLERDARLRILAEVGDALAFAHERGLVHRDLKPANILLDADGRAKLTDFDLVRALDTTGGTQRTQGMGTLVFAAPEALEHAASCDARADIYGLAMTAIFVLGGSPLKAKEMFRRPERAVRELDVPEACREILLRGIEWEAEDRPKTVTEFCEVLAAVFHEQPPAPPSTPPIITPTSESAILQPKTDLERLFAEVETPHGGLVPLWQKIPEGEFLMGSPEGVGYDDEHPQHYVQILSGFQMAATPVTNAQYAAFAPQKADLSKPNHPVVDVTWDEAMEFCDWLGEHEWAKGVRLPTEEEWEYSCRAGTTTVYWSGDDEKNLDRVGWYDVNSGGRVHPVGKKPANPHGLYDMHGNVWEWTLSEWDPEKYSKRSSVFVHNPADLAEDSSRAVRVIRGGSYHLGAFRCRPTYRDGDSPGHKWHSLGFRLIRVVPEP